MPFSRGGRPCEWCTADPPPPRDDDQPTAGVFTREAQGRVDGNRRTLRLCQPKGLHVYAALQARAVGHNQPRSRDRTFDRAGLADLNGRVKTGQYDQLVILAGFGCPPRADTHQLARMDAPIHFAENHHRLPRQLRLDPAGWADRQDMLRQLDCPVDLAVDDEVLAPVGFAIDDDALPILVMPSGACGPSTRWPRGIGGRLTEASSAGCVSTIVK